MFNGNNDDFFPPLFDMYYDYYQNESDFPVFVIQSIACIKWGFPWAAIACNSY